MLGKSLSAAWASGAGAVTPNAPGGNKAVRFQMRFVRYMGFTV